MIVNDTQRYAFSGVHVRQIPGGAILYTTDLPPIPFKKDDTLKALFILDFLTPPNRKPMRIAEVSITGSALEAAVAAGNVGNIVTLQGKPDTTEVHFSRRDAPDANWLLHCAFEVLCSFL